METVPPGTPAITLEAGPGLGPVFAAVRDAAAATPPATYLLVIGALVVVLSVVLTAALAAARRRDRREPELVARSIAGAAAERAPERGER